VLLTARVKPAGLSFLTARSAIQYSSLNSTEKFFVSNPQGKVRMKPVILQLRVIQFSIVVSVLLFLLVLHTIQPATRNVSAPIQWALVLCSIASAELGFVGQRIFLRPRDPSLPATKNSTPLARWFSGHVLRFATAESVALFGFFLRMLGSDSVLVYLFFGSSLLLLLTWRPGTVPSETDQNVSEGLWTKRQIHCPPTPIPGRMVRVKNHKPMADVLKAGKTVGENCLFLKWKRN